MALDPNTIHRMVLHAHSARTACGKDIMAYYPASGYAVSSEAGQLQFRVTPFNKDVNCDACKEHMRNDNE